MQIQPVQITPLLRQMAWQLHKPAIEVSKVVSDEGYKFLLSMAIENKVEREFPNLPITCDWLRQALPKTSNFYSGVLSEDAIKKTKDHLHQYVISQLAKHDKELMTTYDGFFREFQAYRNFVSDLFSIVNQFPEIIESLTLYKEEANALRDIFKTLSDDAYRMEDRVIGQTQNGYVIIIRKPFSIAVYDKLSNLFKRLADKLPSLPPPNPGNSGGGNYIEKQDTDTLES